MNASAILKTAGNIPGYQWTITGKDPFLIFRNHGKECTIETADGTKHISGDPFVVLQKTLDDVGAGFKPAPTTNNIPFSGGAIGAIAYDAKLPDMVFAFFRDISSAPRHPLLVRLSDSHMSQNRTGRAHCARVLDSPKSIHRGSLGASQQSKMNSNFTRSEYLTAVQKIIDHIHEGDIYQANLSQRFEIPFTGDLFQLFTAIEQINPAPMMAYLELPEVTLVSTSPERFLKRSGTLLETSPIKGTRPRGKTPEEDERLRKKLWNSEKDGAELAMIVDLMRNDLGRVAKPGSVVVTDPKRVETYTNVFHLVATVQAEVASDIPATEIIRACFPAGSITGCPKIRAMEIIDELEPVKRSFCYGSIGWIDFKGDFDFNVAIRTFIAKDGKLLFNLGGGIVADSDPEAEYEETLHKGASMFELLSLRGMK